jgi:steroid 5-alpha reductase family enzyme
MFSFRIYLQGLAVVAMAAFATWVLSLLRRNVAIVDSLWSLMFVMAALAYAHAAPDAGARATLVLALVAVWALRLSI